MDKKLYEIPKVVLLIQVVTLAMILLAKIDWFLNLMLAFGYFMLFRQQRWHKHLFIMFIMIAILFFSSRYII
ncbi:MAG: hypothetical protein U9O56_03210 [Campylobacterota bacterium]|nr:hypothetical protein [Campylobacterota bacterium]